MEDEFQSWYIHNQLLFSLIIASLATVLSYQLASIVFDLSLGFKSSGQASASDIGTLLLSEESSLFAILANLGISPRLSRWHFHGHHTKYDCQSNTPRIALRVWLKFFVVLLAAPVANLVAVVLTVEKYQLFSFQAAGFGGLQVALDQSKINFVHNFQPCNPVPLVLGFNDKPVAKFFRCTQLLAHEHFSPDTSIPNNVSLVEVHSGIDTKFPNGSIVIKISSQNHFGVAMVYFTLMTQEKLYRLPEQLGLQERKGILKKAAKVLSEHCAQAKEEDGDGELMATEQMETETGWIVKGNVPCAVNSQADMNTVSSAVLDIVGFKNSPEFRVIPVLNGDEDKQPISGSDLMFFKKRRSILSPKWLFVVVASTVVLRLIVLMITRNDLHLGLALLVKGALQLPLLDSMLQNNSVVDYSVTVTKHMMRKDCICPDEEVSA